jgi:hypothetical protein
MYLFEGSSISLSEEFTIKPTISISKNTVTVGEQISITGSGFSTEMYRFTWIMPLLLPLLIASADATGILNTITISVPPANKATHILKQ